LAALSCVELAAEIGAAREARRSAESDKSGSWRFVVPLFIAARYIHASSAMADAQRRQDLLEAQSLLRQCPS
jgi:hypothetical protein